MDENTFDQATATEWIELIESEAAKVRDLDIYPKLNFWINDSGLKSVLDIGAGQGICALKIKDCGVKYIGIDPSPFMIERAKELYSDEKNQFFLGNAYGLPFDDNHFDGAFSINLLHLLSDLELACFEMSRILKAEGAFFIITAHPDDYKEWVSNYIEKKFEGMRFVGLKTNPNGTSSTDILYLRSYEELVAALAKANLQVLSTESFRNMILIKGQKKK